MPRTWRETERLTDRYDVDPLDSLPQIEFYRRAIGADQPLLADSSYREAEREDRLAAVPPQARIKFLTAWGGEMAASPLKATREHGLVLLRTALEVGDRLHLDAAEACRILQDETDKSCRSPGQQFDPSEPLLVEGVLRG